MATTIGQHISNIRGLIKAYGRTDEYTDQLLYEILKSARGTLLRQLTKQFNHISEWNYQSYTIEMQESDPPNWECVPTYLKKKCKVRRSKYKIPQPIKSRNKSFVNFTTLGGQGIDIYTDDEQVLYKDDPIRSQNIMGSIINGYLYIWNNPDLLLVKVHGVFTDPTDWAEIPDCTGTAPTCFDIKSDDFGLDEDQKQGAYQLVFELLKLPIQLTQDVTNDSNEQIKI